MSWSGSRMTDQYGLMRAQAPPVQRRTKASSKVVSSLKAAVKDLQKETQHHADVEAEVGQTTKYLCIQVQALQKGFLSLSDAVLDELGAVEEERKTWTTTLVGLRQQVEAQQCELDSKRQEADAQRHGMDSLLREVDRLREEMHKLVEKATADAQAPHRTAVEQMVTRFEDLREHVKDQVASVDRSVSDKAELMQSRLQRHFDAAVPRLVEDTLAGQMPEHLQELQADLDAVRRDTQTASSLSASIAKSNSSLAEDVHELTAWCQALDASRTRQHSRLLMESAPAISQSVIDSLSDKVKRQSKQSHSLEEIVRALVMDMAAVAKQSRGLKSHLQKVERSTVSVQDALERSCFVFASTLGIPTPVPLSSTS